MKIITKIEHVDGRRVSVSATKLYDFDELSDEAQARAIEAERDRRARDPYLAEWDAHNIGASYNALMRALDAVETRHTAGPYYYYQFPVWEPAHDTDPDNGHEWDAMERLRAEAYHVCKAEGINPDTGKTDGNCSLTGMCFDCDLVEELYRLLDDAPSGTPSELFDLLDAFDTADGELCWDGDSPLETAKQAVYDEAARLMEESLEAAREVMGWLAYKAGEMLENAVEWRMSDEQIRDDLANGIGPDWYDEYGNAMGA